MSYSLSIFIINFNNYSLPLVERHTTQLNNRTLSELVRPIQSKVTDGRDIHLKLVRYIVTITGICNCLMLRARGFG